MTAGPPEPRPQLPYGTRLVPDRSLRLLDGPVLLGGSPLRLLRPTPRGHRAALRLLAGAAVDDAATSILGRRLVDAGLAHPRPPVRAVTGGPAVTAVVPVRDRAEQLGRCLDALDVPVIVVDDGSRDPAAVAAVCDRPGVTLLRRTACGGPAAARNTGLAAVATDLVALVDSDIVVSPGWLGPLLAHLGDPLVAAAAPRVVPVGAPSTVLARYLATHSPLDMGQWPASVRQGGRVSYVPTACLLVRREALGSFDEALRHGEDVDAVWRLLDAGWQVRYEPAVPVAHAEPASWPGALSRRHRYGSSAGPLARRHPGRLAAWTPAPLPAAAALAAACGLPAAAAVAGAMTVAVTGRQLIRSGLGTGAAVGLATASCRHAVLDLGRYTVLVAPAALVATAAGAGGRRRRRVLCLAALVVASGIEQWRLHRPPLDPVRFTAAWLAHEAAYGTGVWRGALGARTPAPLLPGRPAASRCPR